MIQMIKTAIWGRCQIPLFLAGSYGNHTNYVCDVPGDGVSRAHVAADAATVAVRRTPYWLLRIVPGKTATSTTNLYARAMLSELRLLEVVTWYEGA